MKDRELRDLPTSMRLEIKINVYPNWTVAYRVRNDEKHTLNTLFGLARGKKIPIYWPEWRSHPHNLGMTRFKEYNRKFKKCIKNVTIIYNQSLASCHFLFHQGKQQYGHICLMVPRKIMGSKTIQAQSRVQARVVNKQTRGTCWYWRWSNGIVVVNSRFDWLKHMFRGWLLTSCWLGSSRLLFSTTSRNKWQYCA